MLPAEMRHLRTSPWSGQAAVESAPIAIDSGLPLRGGVSLSTKSHEPDQ